jgi:hypothetical protein
MTNLVRLLLAAALLTSCVPSQPGTSAFPRGEIRYSRQGAGELEAARQRVVAAFHGGSHGVEKLLSEKAMLCGPGCWSKAGLVEQEDYFPVTQITRTSSGNLTRQSAMILTAKARANVARSVFGLVGKSPRIRPLTPSELDLYWAVVPFDLKDPLFVAEANGHRVVLNLGWSDKRNQITGLENLASLNAAKILGR